MQAKRIILHCDCNSFYASVEGILRPELKNVPMAVCGDEKSRHGIILAKNELAKKYNIKTAETLWQARRKCPELVLVSPHHDEYYKYSQIINEIYLTRTDLVEPFGIDESWLDVTNTAHLFGTGKEIGDSLRAQIEEETGLTVSVGVSFNKIFAKLGSDYKKPNATTCIPYESFRDILWPLPVGDMLSVGASTEKTLGGMYVKTIGDLAKADRNQLFARIGKLGAQLHDYANGLDDSPVRSFYDRPEPKSVGNGMTFTHDLVLREDIRVAVFALCERVAARLRRHNMLCSGVSVQLKDPDMKVTGRQRTLDMPTALSTEIFAVAMVLIDENNTNSRPLRSITVTGFGLLDSESGSQLSFFTQDEKARKRQLSLETTLDSLKGRFGRNSVLPGARLTKELGRDENEEGPNDSK